MSINVDLGVKPFSPLHEDILETTSGDQDFQAPTNRTVGAGIQGLTDVSDLERKERIKRMHSGELGSVHSWELVTAVDGPGTRMTVFLAGCPLRCLYCHNPDTFKMKNGAPVEAEELLKRIKRYRRIFRTTGGGITLSGGEAMMQQPFIARVLKGAKEMGVHTAVDTSGFLRASDDVLDNLDLVLLDVKSGIPDIYRKVTGRPLQPTIDFGDVLAERGITVWIRYVIVPGLTDDPENYDAVAKIVSRWPNVARVELLPFHQMGRDKWSELGYNYELNDVKPPSAAHMEKIRHHFRGYGLEVH